MIYPMSSWSDSRRRLAGLLCLLLICLALFLPGIGSLPLTDRDEALFVQASHQMIESGNWVDIRFQDEPRYKKPVGIYWLQGAAVTLSGQGADAPLWVYRLPSLISAVLVVLLTFLIGESLGGSSAGFIAALLAAMTVELAFEARIGKTDAALCAAVAASQLALLRTWLDARRAPRFGRNALFWTALGIGILIKGPVAPMVVGLTGLSLCVTDRSMSLWRSLSPLRGIVWLLLIVLPWLIAIGWISEGAFFRDSVGKDMLGKVASGQEGHGAPPGTHFLVAIATFWPLSAFLPWAFLWAWRNRAAPGVRFAFAWAVPAWIVCELVATKLPNYVLPMMPALAVVASLAICQAGLQPARGLNRLWYFHVITGAVVIAIGLNVLVHTAEGHVNVLGLVLGLVTVAASILAYRFLLKGLRVGAMAALCVTTVAAYGLAYAVLLPAAQQLWLSDRLAEVVSGDARCAEPTVIVVGYDEPSTVFRLGTNTLRTDPVAGAAAYGKASCAVAAVEAHQLDVFQSALATAGLKDVPVEAVEGRNLNGLKLREMSIFLK